MEEQGKYIQQTLIPAQDVQPRFFISNMIKSNMIKVLHILHSFGIGGLENSVANLINQTEGEEFNHTICCISKSGNMNQKLTKNSVIIYELNKKPGNDRSIIPKLTHLIKKIQPDIVHTRNWGTIEGIIAARLAGFHRVIHGEHGWNMDDPYGQNFKRRLARKILSHWVRRFIAVSGDIRQWLIEEVHITSDKVTQIINGVDTSRYCAGNTTNDLKVRYGLKDRIVIGIVGRLDPIKRHDLLMQAFSMLDYSQYNLSLVIVGDGPERARLNSFAKQLPCSDRILFLGERSDVQNLYNLMDIFALVSKNEGISNTILEAMASSLPVIATKVGGNTELVVHDETGLLVSPDSVEAVCQSINYYLEHPGKRKLHGVQGRQRVLENFSLQRMVEEYKKLYTLA